MAVLHGKQWLLCDNMLSIITQCFTFVLTGLRNTHTVGCGKIQNNIPACMVVQPTTRKNDQSISLLKVSLHDKLCNAFNKIRIEDKIQPVAIIEVPRWLGINISVTDPLYINIKPFENPISKIVTIKPPTVYPPKLASKNGNKIMLKIKRRRRKYRQILKVRQRIWPIRRKLNFLKRQQREKKIETQCDLYKKEAERFDFFEIIKKDLEAAKRNGYVYNMVVDIEPNKQKGGTKNSETLDSVLDAMKKSKENQSKKEKKKSTQVKV